MHFNYFIALYLNLDDIVHYGIIVIVSQFHLTIIQKKWGPKIFPLRFVTKQICSNGCHQLNNQCFNNQSGKLPSHASLFFFLQTKKYELEMREEWLVTPRLQLRLDAKRRGLKMQVTTVG